MTIPSLCKLPSPHTQEPMTLGELLRFNLLQLVPAAIGKPWQEADLGKHILHLNAVPAGDMAQEVGRQEDRQGQCQNPAARQRSPPHSPAQPASPTHGDGAHGANSWSCC